MCWNKGRLCWKIAKLFYFCHLKKLVRPQNFGPYYVHRRPGQRLSTCWMVRVSNANGKKNFQCLSTLTLKLAHSTLKWIPSLKGGKADATGVLTPHSILAPWFRMGWFNTSVSPLCPNRHRVTLRHAPVQHSSLTLALDSDTNTRVVESWKNVFENRKSPRFLHNQPSEK